MEAHNGVEALDIFRDSFSQGKNFDIIFMDVNMPVMDVI